MEKTKKRQKGHSHKNILRHDFFVPSYNWLLLHHITLLLLLLTINSYCHCKWFQNTFVPLQDEDYVKITEPEEISVGTLYFGHGGDHYVALRPMQVREKFIIMF